ncbi:MAG: hypothetical protein ACT4PT_02250 [Methanobacteriota archaeon]
MDDPGSVRVERRGARLLATIAAARIETVRTSSDALLACASAARAVFQRTNRSSKLGAPRRLRDRNRVK